MNLLNNPTCHSRRSEEFKYPSLPLSVTAKYTQNMTSPKRRLWTFNAPLVCRLLGLAFDEDQLSKVLKKVRAKDGQRLSTFAGRHGVLVQTCTQQNEVSKYVEKVLERQFEPYAKIVDGVDQEDICRFIEGERGIDGLKNVPLPALIWFAVRNQREDIQEIEARVFNTLHRKEHQALRFYDALCRELPDGEVENVLRELKQALKSKDELQKRYERSQQKREQLKLGMEAIKKDESQLALALVEQKQLSENLKKDLEKLGGQSTLNQIESLRKEMYLLNQEIRTLTEELLHQELYKVTDMIDDSATKIACHDEPLPWSLRTNPSSPLTRGGQGEGSGEEQDDHLSLGGIKVVFVGGLQSLAPHYRQMVETLGGVFCDYFEECRGRKEAEDLVSSADIVFCPIDINSHGACHNIKRACKSTGKPCCFLRSSSLSMFGKELADFARSLN